MDPKTETETTTRREYKQRDRHRQRQRQTEKETRQIHRDPQRSTEIHKDLPASIHPSSLSFDQSITRLRHSHSSSVGLDTALGLSVSVSVSVSIFLHIHCTAFQHDLSLSLLSSLLSSLLTSFSVLYICLQSTRQTPHASLRLARFPSFSQTSRPA